MHSTSTFTALALAAATLTSALPSHAELYARQLPADAPRCAIQCLNFKLREVSRECARSVFLSSAVWARLPPLTTKNGC